jgi:phasin family protein
MINDRNFPFFESDFAKTMAKMKMPGVDVESMLTTQRKNFEAMVHANQLALEGLQAVMRRQVEIFREMVDEASTQVQDIAKEPSAQEKVVKQIGAIQDSFESTLSNMRELSEMLSKSNIEASSIINERVNASLEEFKQTMKTAKEKMNGKHE